MSPHLRLLNLRVKTQSNILSFSKVTEIEGLQQCLRSGKALCFDHDGKEGTDVRGLVLKLVDEIKPRMNYILLINLTHSLDYIQECLDNEKQ